MPSGRAHDERAERIGLGLAAELGKGAGAEARVSDPCESVVPVARPADRLRQRGGGRGDDGPGRDIGERLERERRSARRRLIAPTEADGRRPLAPPADRVLELGIELLRIGIGGAVRVHELRQAVADQEADTVAHPDHHSPHQFVLRILLEFLIAPHDQRIVPAGDTVQMVAVAPDPGSHLAVVESWRHSHLELDRAPPAFQHAQDLSLDARAWLVRDDEAVRQPRLALGSFDRRLQNQRVIEVGAVVPPRPALGRDDRAMAAALVVEQATERAAGVEPGQAAPVDRPPARHQGGALAVADQAVVGDRWVSVSIAHGVPLTRKCGVRDHVRGPTPPVCPI